MTAKQNGKCMIASSMEAASPEVHEKFRWAYDVMAAGVSFALLVVLCLRSGAPLSACMDEFSDMNVLMSGENFAEHGLFRMHFLPVHYVNGIGDNPRYYLHYPPLPNVVNGLLRTAGVKSVADMRWFSALLAVLGLYCMYLAFRAVIGRLAACCGLAVVAASSFIWCYGFSLHQHPYNIFFFGLFALLLLRALKQNSASRLAWGACWAVLLLASLNSFEFILYAQLFAWVYVIATRRLRRHWLALIVLGTAPVAGVGLHFLQNIWAVGWRQAAGDALGFGHFAATNRWELWSQLATELAARSAYFYGWPWLILPILGLVVLAAAAFLKTPGMRIAEATALFLATLVPACAWYLFLPGHALPHQHTANQLLPLVFVVMGGTLAVILHLTFKRGTTVGWRVAGAMCLAVVVLWQAHAAGGIKSQPLPTSVMSEALATANVLPSNAAVLFNTAAEAQFEYYIRRPAWRSPCLDLPFPESIPGLAEHLPPGWELKYYVFYAPPSRENLEAWRYLCENCPGKLAAVPYFDNPRRFIVLFDISELLRPPDQRRPLDPGIRAAQLRGEFATWPIPGFDECIRKAWGNQGGR